MRIKRLVGLKGFESTSTCSSELFIVLLSKPEFSGVICRSWDATREGSRLGINEFKANLPIFMGKVRGRG